MAITIKKKPVQQVTLFSGTRTASANGVADTGYAGVDAIIFQIAVTAASGTTPSLTTKIQDSIDGVNWNDLTTFTAATAATNETKRVNAPFGDWIRSVSTITGTIPSFTYSVVLQAEARANDRQP